MIWIQEVECCDLGGYKQPIWLREAPVSAWSNLGQLIIKQITDVKKHQGNMDVPNARNAWMQFLAKLSGGRPSRPFLGIHATKAFVNPKHQMAEVSIMQEQ